MNKTKYMQTDSRWGGLGYPKKPWYIRNCGCGEVSIVNIIIEMEKYAKYTPATIQPYCKQFAAPNGNGTYHSGIPKMMKHYGLTEVKEHATMTPLWNELAKGNRVAVYLMGSRKGGSKGVKWSSGGHFVVSTGYRYDASKKKHYVYVKDSYSNSSLRNGWITYEENMRGDVLKVWSGKLEIQKSYDGEYPNTNVTVTTEHPNSEKVVAMAKALAWPVGTASSKYAWKGGDATAAFKKALDKVFPNHNKWGKAPSKGASCDVFAATVMNSTGIVTNMPRGYTEQLKYTNANLSKITRNNVKPLSIGKAGDMILYTKNASGSERHVIILGDGVIYEAQYEKTYGHVNTSTSKINTERPKVVIFRAKGTYKTTTTRSYLQRGDKGEEVKKLQQYINWFFQDKYKKDVLKVDGSFGPATQNYAKLMQSELGFKDCDGLVGPKTVEAMKNYKK